MRIKVCCIQSVEEARIALAHGAWALGLVSEMPTPNGVIPEERIREIASAFPAARRFLLTSKTRPAEIADQVQALGVDTVQLVDRLAADALEQLRERLPATSIVQVVHVGERAESLAEARAAALHADALLLDSGTPGAGDGALGGTGRVHDWEVSAEIVGRVDRPVILAGGLRPDNVAAAISRVRPHGVDVCSGLRRQGRLDAALLERFVRAAELA